MKFRTHVEVWSIADEASRVPPSVNYYGNFPNYNSIRVWSSLSPLSSGINRFVSTRSAKQSQCYLNWRGGGEQDLSPYFNGGISAADALRDYEENTKKKCYGNSSYAARLARDMT